MLPCSRPNGIRINLKSTLMKNLKLFRAAGTGARWLFVVCFTLFCCQSLCAQSPNNADHACTVRILDDDGNPVSGAAVVVKGSNTGEISDAKGFVRFRNIPRNATLLVTYLGMDNREEPVNGRSAFDIKLSQGSLVMDELVVVGYGVQRKRDLSGAVAPGQGRPDQRIRQRLGGAGAPGTCLGRADQPAQRTARSGHPGPHPRRPTRSRATTNPCGSSTDFRATST